MTTYQKCSHGKSLDDHCLACEKIWGMDDRRRNREDKMREALVNARAFVAFFHDAPAVACLEQIDDALGTTTEVVPEPPPRDGPYTHAVYKGV